LQRKGTLKTSFACFPRKQREINKKTKFFPLG
jgi:hypothetical protein